MTESLPIDAHLGAVTAASTRHKAFVLVAPPGSGKTTRVPPALLATLTPPHAAVWLLCPRRVAARAAAARIAEEMGSPLGDLVGYETRFERQVSPATRLRVLTEGILTRRLVADPELHGVGAVLLDEFHERSIHADLGLALLREVRAALRPDLVVGVLSATLAPGPVAQFLGGAPVIAAAGRPHPLTMEWLDRPDPRPLAAQVAAAVGRLIADPRDDGGDILVFLPGAREIRAAAEAVRPFEAAGRLTLAVLHGDLPAREQDRVLRPSRAGRRAILATNVAESSLTVPGVSAVVDSGLVRQLRHDPASGSERLDTVRVARDAADQRAGRAGRTGPGRVVRLWTRADDERLRPATPPEVSRVDLAAPVLALHAWGVRDPGSFGWFERPDDARLAEAEALLRRLGAVGPDGRLTARGERLRRLPLHPRLGCVIAAAHAAGCLEDGAALAALVSERDIARPAPLLGERARPAWPTGSSDLLLRLDWLAAAAGALRRGGEPPDPVDGAAARAVLRLSDQLTERARRALGPPPAPPPAAEREGRLLRAILAGFPDRVAQRRVAREPRLRLGGAHGAVLAAESVVRDAALLVAVRLEAPGAGSGPPASATAEPLVRLASAIEPAWLAESFPERVQDEVRLRFDPEAERVSATVRRCYDELVLAESPAPRGAPGAEAELLAAAAARALPRALALEAEPVARLRARWQSLAGWRPELGLPAVDDAALVARLPGWCLGLRSFAELRALPLAELLLAELGPAARRALDAFAPEQLAVPSGSRIRLAYRPGEPPVLAVRLQEMFGQIETPRVDGGRVPVLVQLLGPNGRPVQVTQDLRSFWTCTYPEVRRELRRRYPRHYWPEEPLGAKPWRPGRPRPG